jgi:hypothetical protein
MVMAHVQSDFAHPAVSDGRWEQGVRDTVAASYQRSDDDDGSQHESLTILEGGNTKVFFTRPQTKDEVEY